MGYLVFKKNLSHKSKFHETALFSKLYSAKGFTLVEMMITVAIIGIVMMIAVPSYEGFQARARQKEGFNQLNSFYSASQATRAEFGVYPGNLVQTGYQPVGDLLYRFRSNDGTDINLPFNDDACWNTSNDRPCDCGGDCPEFKTWREIGNAGHSQPGIDCVACFPCPTIGPLSTTDTTFVVGISGFVSPRAGRADVYYMNHQKRIVMCQDGLR
jgi:prepilin-type N-terminal cleavage/methylation domain-containing protein